MHRSAWFVLVAAACISSVGAGAPLEVPNASFETGGAGEDGRILPAHCDTYANVATTADFSWSENVARTGTRSLQVRNFGPRTACWTYGRLPAIGGVTYRVSAWVRLRNAPDGARLSVRSLNAKGKWRLLSQVASAKGRAAADWRRMSGSVTMPADAVEMQILLANVPAARSERPQEVWFDDLTVTDEIDAFVRLAVGPAADAEDAALAREARALMHGMESGAYRSPEQRHDLWRRATDLSVRRQRALRAASLERAAQDTRAAFGTHDPAMVVGWLDSMDRAFLNTLPVTPQVSPEAVLEVFRGETEAVQVIVIAHKNPLRNVRVTVSENGGPVSASVRTVAHVRNPQPVQIQPGVRYAGWWPDPLVERDRFDLGQGESGSVWIQVHVPRDTPPGDCVLPVRVSADGVPTVTLRLRVRVFEASLPQKWYLKKMLSFWDKRARKFYGDRYSPELMDRFYELMIDYRIGLTSMYGDPLDNYPRAKLLDAVRRGQNVLIAATVSGRVRDWKNAKRGADGLPILIGKDRKALAGLERDMAWLKQHALTEISVFYGFDEQYPFNFPLAARTFREVKRKTGLRTMSTIKDYGYTMLGGTLDVFVPALPYYDVAKAARVRRAGKEVWWYTTDSELSHPAVRHRRNFIKTFALRADGYLIWTLNFWENNPSPINNEIRSNWNPLTWRFGSAMLIYPGENGPVSCQRLENMRDGFEDHDLMAYAAELLMRREGLADMDAAKAETARRLGLDANVDRMSAADVRALRRRLAVLLKEVSNP